jgi:hypothetical protein
MNVQEGGLEWRSQRPDGSVSELPLAIRLDNFDIEEYPSKLLLIDHETGLPKGAGERMDFFQLDPMEPKGQLLDYDIDLLEFLPNAAPSQDTFVKAITKATVQAAKVAVANRLTGRKYEGWLSTGELYQPPKPLKLEDKLLLAMARPEPRRFISRVKVFTKEGQEIESTIEVNKPLKAGSWLIYQRNYDTNAGRSSTWSGFELVKDPWLNMARTGLLIWAIGSLGLVIRGRRAR